MPLYMDVHRKLEGLTPHSLRDAHFEDLAVQDRFGVHYHRYFFNETTGTVFCLVEGPSAEACRAVHRASHGLEPDDIIEVQPEVMEAFFAGQRYDDAGAAITAEGRPDGALRVVMFCEIANLAAVLRDDERRAERLLEVHDSLVREVVAAQGGHEVRHTGAGVMAVFGSAAAALRSARHIQRRARRDDLLLRIGMSAGEPVEAERALFGAAVDLARRICDEAGPGQILVSSALRELGLGKGGVFERVGERVLRDVNEPHLLYAVTWQQGAAAPAPLLRRAAARLARFGAEVRRRSVVRVLVAYVIVLLGTLQAAELILEPLGLPGGSYEMLVVAGLIGLPVAIVLAWLYDLTPRGVERASRSD